MRINISKSIFVLFIIFCLILPVHSNFYNNINRTNSTEESYPLYPQAINRAGKIFNNITRISKSCYINREQPGLNNQPKVIEPNYNISHARMYFENITAINYTRNIETEFSEFIISSTYGPKYIYQKFSIEINQYVNNVSILTQDVNNPSIFTDENSWEVAILNCSNDLNGTPNATLGVLKKPHPITFATHWELFDFQNSETGPIFLNTSRTNFTIEGTSFKYWFAITIKIPPDDTRTGGGPKFLYFNPDGENPLDIGEGETFAISPEFTYDNYTESYVTQYFPVNGTELDGSSNSFKEMDNDRYLTTPLTDNLTFVSKIDVHNLTQNPIPYWLLYSIALAKLDWWYNYHHLFIFSFDFYLATNISNIQNVQNAELYVYDASFGIWRNISSYFDIKQDTETLLSYKIRDPWEKFQFLSFMNFSDGDSLTFAFDYRGNGNPFNVSFNQFTIKIGEITPLTTIQQHDPLIQELYFPSNVKVVNGTSSPFGNQTMDLLQYNDDEYFRAQATGRSLGIEFKLNLVPELDESLWNVDYYDWIAVYPNPIIPTMELRISSNVSINNPLDLQLAVLELYKGNVTFDFFPNYINDLEWLPLSKPRDFIFQNETTVYFPIEANATWILLNLLNSSDQNSIKMRLRYKGNVFFQDYNVTIDEFSLTLYIQNAINSDIASRIGLGLKSKNLNPSDIGLKNRGTAVVDDGFGNGIWEGDIDDAAFSQGFFEFNVTSLWHAVRFDVNGTYEMFKIQPIIEFIEDPKSQYKTGTYYFSVRVTEAGGKPLENFEIIFEVLDSGGAPIYESASVTNELGIATASLKFESTGGKFSIRASFTEEGMYASEEEESGYIKVVSEFTIFMDNFMRYLPYLIIGLAAVVSFVTVRHIKHSRQRRIWAGEAKILDDLLKISYIMIINKDVGVSIYNKQISLGGIDSDLISGFLQAISQFRTEIKKDSIKGKGFEMDYYDFKIVITDGDYVRVALILDGTPSEKLKASQIAFTEHFERRFEANLKDFTGDITPFRTADDLIEKYFNVTFVYPLQLGKHYGVVKLKGLEKALCEVAEQIQKEKNFFFISSLLNFALAGRKASRDEIISTIISLKRKGLIVPIEIE